MFGYHGNHILANIRKIHLLKIVFCFEFIMFLYFIINADSYFDKNYHFGKKAFFIDDVIENFKITKFYFFGQEMTFVNNVFLHLNSSNLHRPHKHKIGHKIKWMTPIKKHTFSLSVI